ncbi:MAG: rod shape-determining protein [Blastocatellia bacterium]|nr:rod shape-determining protein [Blastocatellia bacterium]
MKLSWRSLVSDDLGIDLGTSRTRVFARGRGIVVNEPSLLAYDKPSREVVAVGLEALELEGRASEDTQIVSPLHDGVVADSYLAGKLLESYIRKARDGRSHFSRRVLLAVQSDASDIEHYALQYAAREAGINNINFINKGLAVTLGAGFDPEDQRASLVVDVGAGTTTVAGVIHNHVIFSRTIRVGGNDLDVAIANMIKYNHSLLVGPRTAERVKIELGCAVQLETEQTTNVKGRSTVTGSPEMAVINSVEIYEAIEPIVARIIKSIEDSLEALPPEASGDIYDRGLVLAGGGALLSGFDERLSKESELSVQLAESPARAVVRGLGVLFENQALMRRAIIK